MPIVARAIAVLMCLLMVAGCSGVAHRNAIPTMERSFQTALAELSGMGSTECGRMRAGENDAQVMPCVTTALESRRSFRASQVGRGIDSFVLVGLAQNADGELFLVLGDSDVTGGGGLRAEPQVWLFRCESASLGVVEGLREFCVDPVELQNP